MAPLRGFPQGVACKGNGVVWASKGPLACRHGAGSGDSRASFFHPLPDKGHWGPDPLSSSLLFSPGIWLLASRLRRWACMAWVGCYQ